MQKLIISIFVFLIGLLASSTRGDWVKPYVAPGVEVDSIERFLVIPDIIDSTLFGWQIVPSGDQNSDDIADILICRGHVNWGDQNSYMFHGGLPPDAVFDQELVNLNATVDNIGDVNSDGYDDFAFTPLPELRFELHFGGPLMDDLVDFSIPGTWSYLCGTADLDADGDLEIPLSVNVNEGFVRIYDIGANRDTIPEYTITDTSTSFGNNLALGDFNGDGHTDLAVSAYMNRDSNFVKFYWGGPAFDTIADFEIYSYSNNFGQLMVPLGDFNGDSYEDIFIAGTGNYPYGVYFGGPDFDGEMDIVVNLDGFYRPPTDAALAGDINNDGYPDLIWGYYNSVAYINSLYIFLGGPDVDSLADIFIEGTMIPGPQAGLGREVSGIGDFNGDGIDDFAAYSRTQTGCCWIAEVNLFAGWDGSATDVPYEYEAIFPKSFTLSQNYPNPFNPSTTIEFELPVRSPVKLSVYNVLGGRVMTLLDRELAAGSYRIEWNGRDSRGSPVSSGVYFLELQARNYNDLRKMVLLK